MKELKSLNVAWKMYKVRLSDGTNAVSYVSKTIPRCAYIHSHKYLKELELGVNKIKYEGTDHEVRYHKVVKTLYFKTVREAKEAGVRWLRP